MKRIKLTNYRCYKNLELSFKKKSNLLIGDNSSGKTTIIRAIRSVLSSFFTGYSDENTYFKGLSNSDFTVQGTQNSLVNEAPITVNFDLLCISADLKLNSMKGNTLQSPLVPIYNYGKNLKETLFDEEQNQIKSLPLFASFSTEDIHSKRRLSIKPFKQYIHKPSFGYYACLQGDGFFQYWIKRLLVLKEGGKGNLELECVLQAIKKALGVDGCNIISDMEIRPNQGKVYYNFIDGRETEAENLSDGYARLVNIVTDLAFRCALLNQGIYGAEACLKTTGTVLIDEIDLHLHPALQSIVLKSLQNAFPNLQFIATTHAPMVMTGIPISDDSVIYLLNFTPESGYTAKPIDLYGMDASTIMKAFLHTIPRSKDVDELLNELFSFIEDGDYIKASEFIQAMREKLHKNLPDLLKAEAMIKFLNPENDQNK